MISLSVVVLTFLLIFAAIYLIVKANKRESPRHSPYDRKKPDIDEENHPPI